MRLRLRPDGAAEDLFEKLDDTRFNLLVFGAAGHAAELTGLGDLLDVHEIPPDPSNEAELARAEMMAGR